MCVPTGEIDAGQFPTRNCTCSTSFQHACFPLTTSLHVRLKKAQTSSLHTLIFCASCACSFAKCLARCASIHSLLAVALLAPMCGNQAAGRRGPDQINVTLTAPILGKIDDGRHQQALASTSSPSNVSISISSYKTRMETGDMTSHLIPTLCCCYSAQIKSIVPS